MQGWVGSYTVKMDEYKQPFFSFLSYIFVIQITLKWVAFTHSLLQCREVQGWVGS